MKRITAFVFVLILVTQVAFAAAAQSTIQKIRSSQSAANVRIVFDLDKIPAYQVTTAKDGMQIIIDMPATVNKSTLNNLPIEDSLVKSVTFTNPNAQTVRATIDLARAAVYKINTLANPNRLFIDIVKYYDQKFIDEVAPGVKHITLMRSNENGILTAHFIDLDNKANFYVKPILAQGKITGREVLSSMAKRTNAFAAINSSYFASSGELIGLTKLDETIVSTTYLARGAFGIAQDGSPMIGQVDYSGTVTVNGITLPVSGVNNERGENALVLYNRYYDASTKTNEYGMEYVVNHGVVTAIQPSNSALADDNSIVVSVHGTSKEAFAKVKVGDKMMIQQDLGEPWNQAKQIVGVGPLLIKNNSVYLTTKQEQFGPDVASGRAPRTAIGITANKHLLLAVVDGRQSHSNGCSLLEMALLMQEFGAVEAVNFDGGGSSEMVIGTEVINQPSDGNERSVGAALGVFAK